MRNLKSCATSAVHAIASKTNAEEKIRRLLGEIFSGCALQNIGIQLWDGSNWPDDRPRAAVLSLKHPESLGRMFLAGTEVGLAEAYLRDDFDIEGDIAAAFEIADFLLERLGDWKKKLKLAGLLVGLPNGDGQSMIGRMAQLLGRNRNQRHSIERDRKAIRFHYDVSNEFYQLWLDRRMVYSCAYFLSPEEDLEGAQENKLDYLCRKLRLQPGQRLLDIGCGWGGLLIYAARQFGVRAEGITLSENQADYARKRIVDDGLTGKASIELSDYRELGGELERYDAIVSVGMAEHVGRECLADYFKVAYRLLKPGGVFLNQAIGEGIVPRPDNTSGSFIEQYVFPDGDILPLPVMLKAAESAGFEIRDVENLREHYSLTLGHWLHRLERHHRKAVAFADETIYRTWRLYLAGSKYRFQRGHIAVYQTLLAKLDSSGKNGLPLNRSDWYVH